MHFSCIYSSSIRPSFLSLSTTFTRYQSSRFASITSKKAWISRQSKDPFVKDRITKGLASRACFKLDAIQKRFRIFRPGMKVLDLGAAPGGWSQIASQYISDNGLVIGIDLNPIDIQLANAEFIQGDAFDQSIHEQIAHILSCRNESGSSDSSYQFDAIISDMAHGFGGNPTIDVPRVRELVERALSLCHSEKLGLRKGGAFVAKFLQGSEDQDLKATLENHFESVLYFKPKASRQGSRESYCICLRYIPPSYC